MLPIVSTFDLTKLKELLQDFYNLTKIRITVFNDRFEELVAYPEEIAPFCRALRSDADAEKQCRLCDKDACIIASSRHSTYIYRCHAGLTEAISPIYLGNILIGYLFFGHVFSYPDHETGWKEIKRRCGAYQVDLSLLKAACLESPVIPNEYILSSSHILHAVASYLCMERMVVLKQQNLPMLIDGYIQAHLTENIDARRLCEEFQIGRTHLYNIAKQNYGMGIAEYIRKQRIEQAKMLLIEEPEKRIGEISDICGFSDYNYFITMFKRMTKKSPRQYREEELRKLK